MGPIHVRLGEGRKYIWSNKILLFLYIFHQIYKKNIFNQETKKDVFQNLGEGQKDLEKQIPLPYCRQ